MNRQFKEGLGLLLTNQDGAALDMLQPHLAHIARPLRRIEQKIERQTFARADRPMGFELGDVAFRPTLESPRRRS